MNAADQSAVSLLRQDIVQTYLSLAAVDAVEGVGHETFGCATIVFHKSKLVVFCETQM